MKISYRILIINFAIVVLIIGSSAVAFYSIMYNVLTSQQSQYLINSANDFIYAYREMLQDTDDDFLYLVKDRTSSLDFFLENKNIDFILEEIEGTHSLSGKFSKDIVQIPDNNFSLNGFIANNPYAVIREYKNPEGRNFFYGRILSNEFINDL